MENIKILRVFNGVLFAAFSTVALSVWFYWTEQCGIRKCSYDLTEFILRPVLWGSIAWAIITGMLLFFPAALFKKWLLHVGLIGMAFMLYCVLNTDPRSSSFWLDIDRGMAAWASGVVVGLVSVLYIIGTYLFSWVKTKTTPTPWYRLLAIIPAALVMYFFAVM